MTEKSLILTIQEQVYLPAYIVEKFDTILNTSLKLHFYFMISVSKGLRKF